MFERTRLRLFKELNATKRSYFLHPFGDEEPAMHVSFRKYGDAIPSGTAGSAAT